MNVLHQIISRSQFCAFRYNLTKTSFSTGFQLASASSSNAREPLRGEANNQILIRGQSYTTDANFNLPPRILELVNRNLHNQQHHPLWIIKSRIVDFFYKRKSHTRRNSTNSPLFSAHDTLSPVVTTKQNFDSLLVPSDHVSRRPTDTYYVNANTCLRSHTSAHEMDLITLGLDAFLVTGDVYRRDDIDALHYPAFHQLEGVRLFTKEELFKTAIDPSGCLSLFESDVGLGDGDDIPLPSSALPRDGQPCHSIETVCSLEFQLKKVLEELAVHLLGKDVPMRWVPAYFPFTHPSWELEIETGVKMVDSDDGWTEMLGCGILRQEIIGQCGVTNKVAYAFGLGLERWAMKLFGIPDIRLFWSNDSGFLNQFKVDDINKPITYKPVSIYPPCPLDISFWLPLSVDGSQQSLTVPHLEFERDFYELVRGVAGDLVEQVSLIDQFVDAKRARTSYCYRIVYRDHGRTLSLDEIRPIHQRIGQLAELRLKVKVR